MLTIYRASAGAGKTHKLTEEYLLLLFSQPNAYRKILSVTFTNKATDEMKSRIIEELFNLASNRNSDYVCALMLAYNLNEMQVRIQAQKILIAILHDYSTFNISTIDRFFQQTMRAFAREIGLQGGYGIEMDQERVLIEAIDRLFAGLDTPENKTLLGWLLRFGEEKIEGGTSWDLRNEIMALGKEVFKESFKVFSKQVMQDIQDKKFLEMYKNSLYGIISNVENEIREWGGRAVKILEKYRLDASDFKNGKKSPIMKFSQWFAGEFDEPSKSFFNLADNLDGCFKKDTKPNIRSAITEAWDDGLHACIVGAINSFQDVSYYTAKEIVRYYYTLGILADISRHIAEYREEKNVMLIADTTEFLNRVIGGSDAPFIYEKMGTQVDYYMIDEFQDTSGMQWDNFRPLIDESIAHNHANLIVGDVKQSIYRFRNSDWRLLDERVVQDFAPGGIREETLQDNWRSCRHIVEFNNAFFAIASSLLQNVYNENLEISSLEKSERELYKIRIMQAYKQCFQHISAPFQRKDGHVRIDFLTENAEPNWKEEALARLPGILEKLQADGYALKDIAILVRTNLEGAQVAESLLKYKECHQEGKYRYDILSEESLFISRSAVICFFIQVMRFLENTDDTIARQMALFSYRLFIGDFKREDFTEEECFELLRIASLPIYELAESLYHLFQFHIDSKEQVFVQAFLDMISDFVQKEPADLGRFLRWWDETGSRYTIATSDGQDAIRILTIHKSKGLGFRAVVIPFGDWEIDHKPTKPVILWCHPKQKPFNKLHLVPVRYGQVLAKTIFATDYFKEKLYAYIDNLNTLYVAFTRAKDELVILAPRPKKPDDVPTSISHLIWRSLTTEMNATLEGGPLLSLAQFFDDESGVFELGNWWYPEAKRTVSKVIELPFLPLCPITPEDRLHLRFHGKNLFFDNERRKEGTLMHEILSCIRTPQDILPIVGKYRAAGIISSDEAGKLATYLYNLISQSGVASWYDGTAHVLNEVDIFFSEGKSRRPDRIMVYADNVVVVVDYKFGEHEENRHLSQVREYMELIREMGYPKVEGWVWYVKLGKIQSIEPLTQISHHYIG